MDKEPRCPDCHVTPSAAHDGGCDVARCLATGGQRLSCVGSWHDCGRDVWSGRWPGEVECEQFGFWAVFVPNGNPSWRSVPFGTPGAVHDLNRLVMAATWDAGQRRWVILDER